MLQQLRKRDIKLFGNDTVVHWQNHESGKLATLPLFIELLKHITEAILSC